MEDVTSVVCVQQSRADSHIQCTCTKYVTSPCWSSDEPLRIRQTTFCRIFKLAVQQLNRVKTSCTRYTANPKTQLYVCCTHVLNACAVCNVQVWSCMRNTRSAQRQFTTTCHILAFEREVITTGWAKRDLQLFTLSFNSKLQTIIFLAWIAIAQLGLDRISIKYAWEIGEKNWANQRLKCPEMSSFTNYCILH